jgi:Type II secretion system (T2SS), protein J
MNFSAKIDGNNIQTRSSDLLAVTYHLNLPGTSNLLNGLIRTEGDRLAVLMVEDKGGLAEAASRQQALAPEVTMLQFRYFDGKSWYLEWDSILNGRLPRAVEVTLGFGLPPRQGGPMVRVAVSNSINQFRTVVLVPIADPLPEEFVP